MPFMNTLPQAKIYDKKYSPVSMHIYARLIARENFPDACTRCNAPRKRFCHHVHHKNRNVWDNRIENLEPLCAKCHDKETYPNGHGGWKMSEEQKRKISKANKGKRLGMKFPVEWRENIRKGHTGMSYSVFHRRRISEGFKKRRRRLQRS